MASSDICKIRVNNVKLDMGFLAISVNECGTVGKYCLTYRNFEWYFFLISMWRAGGGEMEEEEKSVLV